MATLTPTNGTLRATTLEGQIMECFTRLFLLEKANGLNYVSVGFNASNSTFTGTANLPVSERLNENGQAVISAENYLPSYASFNAGEGEMKATTIMQRLHELVVYAQNMEKNTESNVDNQNRITSSTSSDNSAFTATVNLGFTLSVGGDGLPKEEAIEYLVDLDTPEIA